jgi:hypothetical protein
MVVVLKIPNPLLQNFFHYDVDMPIVSCDYVPWSGCPLRVGELVVDARCDLPPLEPYIFILENK